jgi:hypothetical protein
MYHTIQADILHDRCDKQNLHDNDQDLIVSAGTASNSHHAEGGAIRVVDPDLMACEEENEDKNVLFEEKNSY